MIRTVQAAAAFAVLVAAFGAEAAPAVQTPDLHVSYRPADLATDAGRQRIRSQFTAAADSWCRANPVGGTIARCKGILGVQLSKTLEVEAQAYAKAHNIELARR